MLFRLRSEESSSACKQNEQMKQKYAFFNYTYTLLY